MAPGLPRGPAPPGRPRPRGPTRRPRRVPLAPAARPARARRRALSTVRRPATGRRRRRRSPRSGRSGRRAGRVRRSAGRPRRRCRAGRGHSFPELLPRDVLVDAWFGGEAEYPFGDDVAQDLRGAALDGVALGAQVAIARVAAGEVDLLRPDHGPVGVAQPLLAEHLELEAGQLLVEPGVGELHRRTLRPRLADGQLLPQPRPGEPSDLRLDPQPQQPVVQFGGMPLGMLAPGVRDHADHPAFTRRGPAADGHPLVVQGGVGDLPAHTFGPLTTQVSPSRTARVATAARSEPAPGSLNSWHHTSSPVHSGLRKRRFWASLPNARIVGAAMPRPMVLTCGVLSGAPAASKSRSTSNWSAWGRPSPPCPSGKDTQASPAS